MKGFENLEVEDIAGNKAMFHGLRVLVVIVRGGKGRDIEDLDNEPLRVGFSLSPGPGPGRIPPAQLA